ncbi:MAG TPA: tetratricopeptide repeat protein [Steroidobacteraceae bacterium]|nr:tetratricopeptide repeat protein [Steroidobacteraceae bacterium]
MELLSEEEQWESLKRWLRENVPFILGLVAVGLLAVFGWRWWQGHEDTDALEAGASYQRILATFDAGKTEDALSQVEALRRQHPKSGYVSSADLAAAKIFVLTNDLEKAVQRLERVMNESPDEQLRPIARLRLARVLTAQGQYDRALETLGTQDRGRQQPAYLEARGDVLLAKGDRAGALAAYEAAKKALPPSQSAVSGVGELLDLKINDLRATQSTEAPAKP